MQLSWKIVLYINGIFQMKNKSYKLCSSMFSESTNQTIQLRNQVICFALQCMAVKVETAVFMNRLGLQVWPFLPNAVANGIMISDEYLNKFMFYVMLWTYSCSWGPVFFYSFFLSWYCKWYSGLIVEKPNQSRLRFDTKPRDNDNIN